ncbi:cell wall metabolism sensor histidine kinase WalK [Anaeromyxobacter sp. Fw109-5]|uniref:sensor histidine kinase n=1 Tax=Anaeromyxobacter sp. (strain Fw109-5) TaxID=404589 RepID=UPI0000ED80C3|nr:HAMP domain-containing sensor histidine kinase [Anaeromyxobacter sp. Fw109-5]ABS25090.1 integral membrane sensor signal transduction histidine kinase [Anaeromyxobacter sp. Fw109-5]
MTAPARRHGRLFWRIYLHGLLLLFLVALATASVGWALRQGGSFHERGSGAASYAASRVAELSGEPARLRDELARWRESFGLDASVYGPDGALRATSVEPPLDPGLAESPPRDRPVRLRRHGFGRAVPLADGGLLLIAGGPREPDPLRGLAFIGAVLAALALGSIPLARSIAAPIERLTVAARALGSGDLSARAGVKGRGEVGELGRAFDEMAERLERLVRGEQELLANVSHELRTPLARIRVALELAAEGDVDRARRFLAEIGTDLDELDRLVEDVLAAARLDLAAGGGPAWPVTRARVDLDVVLAEAAARFREAHPARTLDLLLPESLPAVDGDAALLRRLVANLLDNAAKYSEPPAPVALAAGARDGGIELEVRDQGIGIDPDDLSRVFTPFFRTDRSRARGTGGVGMGLALARRIAEAHGGTITVESTPGRGTTFRVVLPASGVSGAPHD